MPLYQLWEEGTSKEIVFAAVHCTGGDILIALVSITAALILTNNYNWPKRNVRKVITLTIVFGFLYTVFSEWLNIEVREAWAYSDLMPVIPIIEMGLSPALQWVVVPTISLWWASKSH